MTHLMLALSTITKTEKKVVNMETIKAVLFDLDGTLTDTEKFYQTAWPQALAHFGYEMSPEKPLELRSLGRPFAVEKFKEWYG